MFKHKETGKEVKAIQYRPHENCAQVLMFVGDVVSRNLCMDGTDLDAIYLWFGGRSHQVAPGEWVVERSTGEFVVMTQDQFADQYEAAEE